MTIGTGWAIRWSAKNWLIIFVTPGAWEKAADSIGTYPVEKVIMTGDYAYLKQVLTARVVRRLTVLEDRYIAVLEKINLGSGFSPKMIDALDSRFTRLIHQVEAIKRYVTKDRFCRVILEQYMTEIRALHQDMGHWLGLYGHWLWPAGLPQASKQAQGLCAQAPRFWETLRRQCAVSRDKYCARLIALHDDLEHYPANTVAWRITFQKLSAEILKQTRAQLNATGHTFRYCFQRIIVQSIARCGGEQVSIHQAADWLSGYCLWPGIKGSPALQQRVMDLRRVFQRAMLKIFGKRVLIVLMCVVLMAGIITYVRVTKLDQRLGRLWHFQISQLFQRDAQSDALREKKEYFDRQIERIHDDYSPAMIWKNLTEFNAYMETFEGSIRYTYFAQNVLKGYFLLLPDGSVDSDLTAAVVDAAYRLEPEIGRAIDAIARLYGQLTIREEDLRNLILEMRRPFVKHWAFVFVFVALKEDVPYLFVFPEEILVAYRFSPSAFDKLGLAPQEYRRSKPLAYLVRGDQYPFSGQAGYFEGEFAVVFKRLTPTPHWTAYHEIGHVMDKMRFERDGIPYLKNSEVNAMLFPLIWTKSRHAYLNRELMGRAMRKDYYDSYAQASKGILNGLALLLREQQGRTLSSDAKISDEFEEDRIRRIVQQIDAVPTETLKDMALTLYKNPAKYLASARPGRYVVQGSSFQEIIYGTDHGVSKQGFILGSSGFSLGRKGPRLLLAGAGSDEGLNISFDLWAFIKNVLRILLSPWQALPQSSGAENLVAAIATFILFNVFSFGVQVMAAPYRKRRFYGRDPAYWIDWIYDGHAWSDGESVGWQQNEKALLKQALASQGNIPMELQQRILNFKSLADDRQRLLFDGCLLLAPLNPLKTRILHKGHDLLFFLPWLGPWLGRAAWLLPAQKDFEIKEKYNQDLAMLLHRVDERILPAQLLQDLRLFLQRDAVIGSAAHDPQRVLTQVAKEMLAAVTEEKQRYHLNLQFITTPLTRIREESQEFDRLDLYSMGDDIRHIDWRATARGLYDRPIVRRFSCPYGIRIGLLLEMRYLNTPEGRIRWRQDLIKALDNMEEDSLLELLMFVLPNGKIEQCQVNLRIHRHRQVTSRKILALIQGQYAAIAQIELGMDINGLRFYGAEENGRFANQIRLSDFGKTSQHIQQRPIALRGVNIFPVGVTMSNIRDIQNMISGENKIINI